MAFVVHFHAHSTHLKNWRNDFLQATGFLISSGSKGCELTDTIGVVAVTGREKRSSRLVEVRKYM
jgi:hypothetical protein